MGKGIARLTALEVRTATKPGRISDGGGLYLQVTPTGTKSWIFRYMIAGKSREMGLGSLNTITLAHARDLAAECRRSAHVGKDPIEVREAQTQIIRAKQAVKITFDECARQYINAMGAEWTNPKHRDQWVNTLAEYVSPVFGKMNVGEVSTELVVRALQPIWREKTETATRIRGRIEVILDWATVNGYRSGENPARWRGHMDKILPRPSKIKKVSPHAALPYAEMADFMPIVRRSPTMAAKALELLILTLLRTSELIGGKWEEFDFEARLWTVPAKRMKTKVIHRVPLSNRAIEILKDLRANSNSEFIFPGRSTGHLSNMAILELIKDLNYPTKITGHGFRSTFRDWAAECTNHPNEVCEMALAHKIENKVEAAYRRGDLFNKRRRLMEDWGAFCVKPAIDLLTFTA